MASRRVTEILRAAWADSPDGTGLPASLAVACTRSLPVSGVGLFARPLSSRDTKASSGSGFRSGKPAVTSRVDSVGFPRCVPYEPIDAAFTTIRSPSGHLLGRLGGRFSLDHRVLEGTPSLPQVAEFDAAQIARCARAARQRTTQAAAA